MENRPQARNTSLDLARVIAILAVITLHCCSAFLINYESSSIEFIVGNLINSTVRFSVPLFLMISGSLFLDEKREISLKTLLFKNIKNLAFIAIFWAVVYSVLYNVLFLASPEAPIDFKETVADAIKGHYHMWYLFIILGLYLATPFLRKFVCKENKALVLFFIAISFLFHFLLPLADQLASKYLGFDIIQIWVDKFQLGFFSGYLAYFLLGWYLVHVGMEKKFRRILSFFGIASLVYIIVYIQFTGDYKTAYENISAPIFLYSASVFAALTEKPFQCSQKAAQRLAKLSSLTFGVYITHAVVLKLFTDLFPYRGFCLLYILLCFFAVTAISFLITYVISKIPLLKKAIRG